MSLGSTSFFFKCSADSPATGRLSEKKISNGMFKEEFMDDSFPELKCAERLLPIRALTAFIVERHNVTGSQEETVVGKRGCPVSRESREAAWL